MARRAGLRWRFLAAFGTISGISIAAAMSGLSAIFSIDTALEMVTEERTPVAIESLLLSRHVERVVTAAPSLLSAPSGQAAKEISADIALELTIARDLLDTIRRHDVMSGDIAAIADLIKQLKVNLTALGETLARRRGAADRKAVRLQELEATSIEIRRFLMPGLAILDARIRQHRGGVEDARLASEIADLTAVQEAEFARAAVEDALALTANAESAAVLDLLAFPLERALTRLDAAVSELDPTLRARMTRTVERIEGLARADDGVPALRQRELALTREAETHLAVNSRLSEQLRVVVDRLITRVDAEIASARAEVQRVRASSIFRLVGLSAVSIAASALIVWLYVDRNLLRRLGTLSRSMLAVADGDLRIPIARSGSDEITDMADALTLFRNTALEIEERHLRRADEFLNVILPPSAADELKATGKVEPRAFDNVAIVFTDIVGFTRYCESRDAQEIVSALDLFARRSEDIIHEEGLEKIKTVGDGLLMTCNLLRPHDDAVMAAIRCAQRLSAAAETAPLSWQLRSGVHYGSVVGGVIGRDKFTFDVWGDAVNIASRLSDLAEAEICLSPAAWEQVEGRCGRSRSTTIEIKGLGSSVGYLLERKDNEALCSLNP